MSIGSDFTKSGVFSSAPWSAPSAITSIALPFTPARARRDRRAEVPDRRLEIGRTERLLDERQLAGQRVEILFGERAVGKLCQSQFRHAAHLRRERLRCRSERREGADPARAPEESSA